VFDGVGRVVERPNRSGDSDKVTRDDLVFPEGVLHIVNLNGHVSMTMNRQTCKLSYKAQQTNTVEGGTGRFTHATGSFASTVTASAVAHRKTDGGCDLRRPPTIEFDIFASTGTLTF
jgi:hypothetical protein